MTSRDKFQGDEYQFPQDGFADDMLIEASSPEEAVQGEQGFLVEEQSSSPSALANIWQSHKKVIIVAGVVVVVATVFGMMRMTHKPAEALPTPVTQAVETAPVAQPIMDPQVADQLTDLRQDSINNTVVIRQLQSQIAQLDNSLSQSRNTQQQLTQSLALLVGQVQELTGKVQELSKPKAVKAATPAAKPVPVITYQLRAVVPGRAWIVASDGQSQSISVGDAVPQYGNVQSIDADAGVVITSSGKTIKF